MFLQRALNTALALFIVAAACMSVGAAGCNKNKPASAPDKGPSLRVYVLGGVAGALEPCGCVKDMLGGIDHAARLVRTPKGEPLPKLVLGAGPMFFENPELEAKGKQQELWKAEALAASLKEIGLAAWAPGANDWAAGAAELKRLQQRAGAKLLAANLKAEPHPAGTSLVSVGGYKFGIAGVSVPKAGAELPGAVKAEQAPKAALTAALKTLEKQGAQIKVALLALPRGQALRLAESVPGYHLYIVGKSFDRGETNDPMVAPVLLGESLVVQAPNHLQALAVVDLHIRDGKFVFTDGSGLALQQKRESLEQRIQELERRIDKWQQSGAAKSDLDARRADLSRLRKERASLKSEHIPKKGSYFEYDLVKVRETVGSDSAVHQRLLSYYKRVNEHNRIAFKDHVPPPVPEGQSGFVGVQKCSLCHVEEAAFWKKTPHATAYSTLSVQNKQFNLDCVSCHVTGYEQPGGSTVTHVEGLTNVQCETCHGPGSRHVENSGDKSFITRRPAADLCASQCHHPPHVHPGWDVAEAWKHIIGPGHGG